MTKEQLRMQMLSGVITESEYKAKLEESTSNCGCDTKDSLNENFIGMGMVGNIFDREKTDYELAFEHFTKGPLSENEDMEDETPVNENLPPDRSTDSPLYMGFIKAANYLKGSGLKGDDTVAWDMMWDEVTSLNEIEAAKK